MSQFINIKKLTANALIAALVASGSINTFTADQALAKKNNNNNNSCNNGHGNNAPVSYSWDGGILTISQYDPSNNGKAHDGTDLIKRLKAGSTETVGNGANATTFTYKKNGVAQSSYTPMSSAEATALIENFPDWELKGNGGIYDCGSNSDLDGDGISNVIEIGNDVANPFDTDSDGIPDYNELDSDNDGVDDATERGSDSDNPVDSNSNGIPDYRDSSIQFSLDSLNTSNTPNLPNPNPNPTPTNTSNTSNTPNLPNPNPNPTPTEENYCNSSSDFTNDSGILVTLEDAGVQTPQISSNNYVFDFNSPSFSSGGMTRTHAAITYTYEGNYSLSDADKWGGANLSKYIHTTPDVADCFRVLVDQDRKYFGFWWSAGDAYNKLTFKNDGVEVAVFVTEDLKNFIENTNTTDTSAYYGNPNGGNNSASNQEPYSFVNIFFGDNVAYDEIIFETTTDNGASFESDNHTFSTSSDPRGNRVTNDAPVAGDDNGEVEVTQTIAIDLLANDSDPDLNLNTSSWTTEDLSITKIEGINVTGGGSVYLYKNGNDITAAANPDTSNSANYIGEVIINGNGELEFTAAYLPNMNPGYNIEYTLSDVFGDSDPSNPGTDNGTVTIKVRPFSD